MNARIVLSLALAAALPACATVVPGGGGGNDRQPEFVGRSLSVQTANGQTSTLSFERDGTVEAEFNGRETRGRWALEDRQLCFTWGGNFRECWPYARPFRQGRTTELTSDRGNKVQVTLR